MHKIIRLAILLALVSAALQTEAASLPGTQTTETGTVIKITDGDTIVVKIGKTIERVRLIGIDTPEIVDPRKPVQCFASEASQNIKRLVDKKTIALKSEPLDVNRDKYGRLLRYVYLTDDKGRLTTFLNATMIKDGYAYKYNSISSPTIDRDFSKFEKDAKAAKKGLWNPQTCNGKRTFQKPKTTKAKK